MNLVSHTKLLWFFHDNNLNNHQFLHWSEKYNNTLAKLIPVKIPNPKQPVARLRLSNGCSLEIMSQEALLALVRDSEILAVLLSSMKSIWLYPMMVDFRKQLDGLIVLIVEVLDKDPSSGDLYIFRNRSGNTLKCVYFDGRCFWLLYCRLEKGRFKLPEPGTAVWELLHNEI